MPGGYILLSIKAQWVWWICECHLQKGIHQHSSHRCGRWDHQLLLHAGRCIDFVFVFRILLHVAFIAVDFRFCLDATIHIFFENSAEPPTVSPSFLPLKPHSLLESLLSMIGFLSAKAAGIGKNITVAVSKIQPLARTSTIMARSKSINERAC